MLNDLLTVVDAVFGTRSQTCSVQWKEYHEEKCVSVVDSCVLFANRLIMNIPERIDMMLAAVAAHNCLQLLLVLMICSPRAQQI